ncbi:MAG: glycosyltransferase family 4 protein [Bacteroidetes bacterium]|nr:glycosyltransferase family 4 protein [Bacteroidota bacterium]
MKIAIYLDSKEHGGVDTHLLCLLQNWPDKEDQFILFYNHDNDGVKKNIVYLKRIQNLKLVQYKRFNWDRFYLFSFFFAWLIFFYEFIRGVFLLKIHGEFDVLISDNGGFPGARSCTTIIFSSTFLKIPKRVLLIHHAAMPRIPIFILLDSIKIIGLQKCATDLVTVSLATRTTLVERRHFNTMINPIRVIPNGINLINGLGLADINLRERYNITKDEFILGIISRVERYKGQEDIIIALSRLPKEIKIKFKVLIVGGGNKKEIFRLKSLVKKYDLQDRVIFTGFIENKSDEIINCFDVLLMLTKDFEAFNYTIAEAMSIGIPTIITNVGAIPEYYNSDIARIISPESPDMICEAIIDFYNNPTKYSKMAYKAKEHIQKFNALKMAYNFHDLIS